MVIKPNDGISGKIGIKKALRKGNDSFLQGFFVFRTYLCWATSIRLMALRRAISARLKSILD